MVKVSRGEEKSSPGEKNLLQEKFKEKLMQKKAYFCSVVDGMLI